MTDLIKLTSEWLEVLPDGNFEAFSGKVSPDFVLRLPFVPDSVPSEFRGRDVAQSVLRASAQGRSPLIFTDKVIRRTEDPELALTTARAEAVMANGKPYKNEYIMLTRIRDGVVLEHVEYLNPLEIIAASD